MSKILEQYMAYFISQEYEMEELSHLELSWENRKCHLDIISPDEYQAVFFNKEQELASLMVPGRNEEQAIASIKVFDDIIRMSKTMIFETPKEAAIKFVSYLFKKMQDGVVSKHAVDYIDVKEDKSEQNKFSRPTYRFDISYFIEADTATDKSHRKMELSLYITN